ncbi:MAG: hypothetical protein U1E30_10460 [Rhodoblastus sp.]
MTFGILKTPRGGVALADISVGIFMLGPADIADWDGDEADRLRAEIRLLPIMRRMSSEPDAVRETLGDGLAARLDAFRRDARRPAPELRALLHDLRRARR